MKKIRLLALLTLGMLVSSVAYAQSLRVSGVVTSQEDGEPLPGVTVFIKGTSQGMATGADGSYALNNVPSNGTLEFRYVGMRTHNVAVAGKQVINVIMVPDAIEADQATVTALGVTKQNRKLGYSTTTVDGEELARNVAMNPLTALQGKVAGMRVMQGMGTGITASPGVLIRGAGSITKGNAPIFIIDGVVVEHFESGRGGSQSGEDGPGGYGSQMKNFNMEEFESVTVLKGAAATTLYGSRGANGAIVVTSKAGRARKGVGIEVNYSHTFEDIYAPPMELQNRWGGGRFHNGYEGNIMAGTNDVHTTYSRWSWGPDVSTVNQKVRLFYRTGPYGNEPETYTTYPDNWRAYFNKGHVDKMSVAFTGGSDKATYRLSYSYRSELGSLPNNTAKIHQVRFVTNGKLNDFLSTDLVLQYNNSKFSNRANQGAWNHNNNYNMLLCYYLNRSVDLDWYKDNYIQDDWSRIPAEGEFGNIRGYFDRVVDNRQDHSEVSIMANVGMTAQLTDWLDLRGAVSLNNWSQSRETRNYGGGAYREGGEYRMDISASGNFNAQMMLHSNNKFANDELELDIRLIAEAYGPTKKSSAWQGTRDGLAVPGLWSFSNSKNPIEAGNKGFSSTADARRDQLSLGLGATAALSWRNQLTLELTARNDWLSTLTYPVFLTQGANNFSVFYPGVNAAWVFSDTFETDPGVLSYGKFYANWARVGSGTSRYTTSDGAYGYNQSDFRDPADQLQFLASPNITRMPNFDLKPEISQTIEFGADVRFLNDRIGANITWYKRNNFNQIMGISAVQESGVTGQTINAGNIQWKGWEIAADFTPIQTREVTWKLGGNWTRDRSLIKELHESIKASQYFGGIEGSGGVIYAEGGAYGMVAGGAGYGAPGRAYDPRIGKYVLRGDGTVPNSYSSDYRYQIQNIRYASGSDMPRGDYYTPGVETDYYDPEHHAYDFYGNQTSKFYYGFWTSVSYKGFDLSVNFEGRHKGTMMSTGFAYVAGSGNSTFANFGRSADNGGVKRINYKGETTYDGIILDGVFGGREESMVTVTSITDGTKQNVRGMTHQQAIDAGYVQPIAAGTYYLGNFGWGVLSDLSAQDMTYLALRDVTLSYNFPSKWMSKIGVQSLQLQFSCQNICYITNRMKGKAHPEGQVNNNIMSPADMGGAPFVRYYSLSLNVRF